MDTGTILAVLQESFFMIVVFVFFFIYTIRKGRQSITNLILGLYFALLISIEFPYYDVFLGGTDSAKSEAVIMVIVFAIFTTISTYLFARILPREYDESAFEGFGRKVLLAIAGTILFMTFSYHVLPITEFLTPGSPIEFLFGSTTSFFWWLMAPLVILFLV